MLCFLLKPVEHFIILAAPSNPVSFSITGYELLLIAMPTGKECGLFLSNKVTVERDK